MKKSLLALAVLGAFTGVASAQSSVTIYGLVDLGVYKSNGGTAVNPGTPGTSEAWTLSQAAGSRLGFRGTEDLGGGLSAQFQIEHRFNADTGTSSAAPFWQGRSYVQLTSAAAGAVYMGREYTPIFWIQLKSDPFGNDGVGQTGTGITYAGYYTPDVASGVTTSPQAAWPAGGSARTSNTVGYKTPNLGGLTANVALGLSENSGQGRNVSANIEYAGGPLYAGAGMERVSKGTGDGRGLINFAVHYDLGFVKPMVYFAKAKAGPNGDFDNKVILLSATAPLAGGKLKLGVSRISFDEDSGFDSHTKIGVGFDYPLSKRTGVYADLGAAKGRSATGAEGNRNTSYAVGLKHTF